MTSNAGRVSLDEGGGDGEVCGLQMEGERGGDGASTQIGGGLYFDTG